MLPSGGGGAVFSVLYERFIRFAEASLIYARLIYYRAHTAFYRHSK